MPSFLYDLRYLLAGSEVLKNYILSPEIYWPIGSAAPPGEAPYPQLTLGNMRLARLRAASRAGTRAEKEQLDLVNQKITGIQMQWRVAWSNKALQETQSRLTQWRNFLEDYRESSQANYDRYAYEVSRRVVIQLLLTDVDFFPNAEQEMIRGLDGILEIMLIRGEFIWDKDLQSAFSSDAYWYLYGRLPIVYPGDN